MDKDFEVAWPELYAADYGEISAIQYAMNHKIRDERAFWSEMQNQPIETQGDDEVMCKPQDILDKMTGYRRGLCPADTVCVTAMIDPKISCLHLMVVAWSPGFVGHVIDYRVIPDQGKTRIFSASQIRKKFDDVFPHKNFKEQVYLGLKEAVLSLSGTYPVDGGGELTIKRCLVDANMGQISNTVYQFCREYPSMVPLTPSHGLYVGASSKPWSDLKRLKGERVGPHWRDRPSEDWPIRHVNMDVNHWKTIVHTLIKAGFGDASTISFYGRGANGQKLEVTHHLELADQVCAEYCVKVQAKNRTVHEW
jgi:hypothetical protein